jgi:hypothetical protein
MAGIQPYYIENNIRATLGMVGNMETWNAITLIAEDGNIAFGACVGAGTTEDQGKSMTTGSIDGTTAIGGTNVGNGVLTPSLPFVDFGATAGAYVVTILADTTKFSVTGPGSYAGAGTVGAEFNGPVNFTLADGTVNFAVGDTWTITAAASAAGAFRGIAIRDTTLVHASGNGDVFEPGDEMAVLTMGTIWVTAGATVVPGDDVYFVAASGKYTTTAAGGSTLIPAAEFDTAAGDGQLVRIRLK